MEDIRFELCSRVLARPVQHTFLRAALMLRRLPVLRFQPPLACFTHVRQKSVDSIGRLQKGLHIARGEAIRLTEPHLQACKAITYKTGEIGNVRCRSSFQRVRVAVQFDRDSSIVGVMNVAGNSMAVGQPRDAFVGRITASAQ